jgi:hypothetical protein
MNNRLPNINVKCNISKQKSSILLFFRIFFIHNDQIDIKQLLRKADLYISDLNKWCNVPRLCGIPSSLALGSILK